MFHGGVITAVVVIEVVGVPLLTTVVGVPLQTAVVGVVSVPVPPTIAGLSVLVCLMPYKYIICYTQCIYTIHSMSCKPVQYVICTYMLLHFKSNTDHTSHFHSNSQEHYLSLCASHLPPCTAHLVCKPVVD